MNTKTYENPVIGNKVVFQKTSEQTNGNYSLIEVTLAPAWGKYLALSQNFFRNFSSHGGNTGCAGKQRT